MDGQHDTRKGSSRRPSALLEIYNIFHMTAVHQIFTYIFFFTGEDEYSQDRFPAIQKFDKLKADPKNKKQ